jgi:acyl carrier protein
MSVKERLRKVFREVFDDESIELSESMTANDIDAWDSLSHVNLLIAIEIEFGFDFNPNEIYNFANVGDLLNSINTKMLY